MYAWKSIAVLVVALLSASNVAAEDSMQRIPLAVDSDFQMKPVDWALPDQKGDPWEIAGSPVRIIGFEPDQPIAKPVSEKQAQDRSWWSFMRGSRESCIASATKLPTDAGVRIAYGECDKRFPKHGR